MECSIHERKTEENKAIKKYTKEPFTYNWEGSVHDYK